MNSIWLVKYNICDAILYSKHNVTTLGYSLFCVDNSWHANRLHYNYTVRLRRGTLISMTLPFPCARRIMIRSGMLANIKLIRKHPKIRRILRCKSPYFHHWSVLNDATFSGKTGNVGPETMDQIEEMENVGL